MNLHLRDKNPAVVAAWREVFADMPNVTISEGDILELEGDAIVSPANSFGWMDGGIDLAYRERFGVVIEQRLRRQIAMEWSGELPVGCASLVATNDERIRWVLSAPTMRIPGPVPGTLNAYLALRGALHLVSTQTERASFALLCPGLCTLTGQMPPRRAALQMRYAWSVVVGDDLRLVPPLTTSTVVAMHRAMLETR